MNILFIAKYKLPHIGGVEKHLRMINEELKKKNYKITTISEEDIKPPHIKYFGLLYIWFWLFKNRELIARSNLVHIHDVFIWYLPFRLLFPFKKVYITFHGWEGKWPIPLWNIINKRVANLLCNGSIAVGKYIEKYYDIKPSFVVYGGAEFDEAHGIKYLKGKTKNSLVFLGRQDADTGINEFKEWLKIHGKHLTVKFVSNDPNPEKYLKTAEYCVPSGYLSYLESLNYGCKILTFANNPLKIDYWKEIRDIYDDKSLKSIPTWNDVCDIYIKLWRS
ncbi:MAG: glycosyl transferase, group 1 family protein [uncultured bacterium]|nr:MAG: glycosyl transferase, group 1 family protein [uncultured bacterium]